MISKLFVVVVLTLGGVSAMGAVSTECQQLELSLNEATERTAYAKNAWLNREIVCEADLDRPRCFDYLRNDYKDAKRALRVIQKSYKEANCLSGLN